MSVFNTFVEFVARIVAPMQRQFINFIRIAIFYCNGMDRWFESLSI